MPSAAAAMIAIDDLIPSARNIRSRLGDLSGMVASMREVGVLQALLVRPHPTQPGKFVIVGGHRRHAAAKQAGLRAVPCLVRSGDRADERSLMIVENAQRQQLDPIDMARAFAALAKTHTVAEVARMTGFSAATVRARVGLLTLPDQAQEMVSDGVLTLADAQVLVAQVADQRSGKPRSAGPRSVPVGRQAKTGHFDKTHRLAAHVVARCTHREMNRRTYGPGCGDCWEQVIREDALGTLPALCQHGGAADATVTALHAVGSPAPGAVTVRDFDDAAVERIVNGGFNAYTGALRVGDREEIVRRLHARGYSDRRIAAQAGFTDRTVQRIRARLGLAAVPAEEMTALTQ